ncbi:MAG: hypothetical protein WAJ93_04590, partial [Candidatus Nitrosopolaris sp.]
LISFPFDFHLVSQQVQLLQYYPPLIRNITYIHPCTKIRSLSFLGGFLEIMKEEIEEILRSKREFEAFNTSLPPTAF